jgi:hypothetical protein
VALSIPIDATGVFDSDNADSMYLPFEGNGLDSTWELRVPRPANRWDYRTMTDALVTFDYGCLHDYDYRQAVVSRLDPVVTADLTFSLKNDFPDAWYDLNNAELLDESQRWVVAISIDPSDSPANLSNHRLKNVALRFCGEENAVKTLSVFGLSRTTGQGQVTRANNGAARAVDGNISTRNGSGALWQPLVGASAAGARPTPFGSWEINLRSALAAQNTALRDALASGALSDIIFALTYAADTPPWPQ